MKLRLLGCLAAFFMLSQAGQAQELLAHQSDYQIQGPLPAATVTAPPVKVRFEKVLGNGSEGAAVKDLQVALLDLGFGIPAGATGYYGRQTVDAVAAFQSSQGLPTTGKADQKTLARLEKVANPAGQKVWQSPREGAVAQQPRVENRAVRVLVDLSEYRLTVYGANGEVERVFPLACGAPGTPTDRGLKVVYDKVADPTAIAWSLWPESGGRAFGDRLLDLSWYDAKSGKSWGSGEEMHGTDARNSIGSQASHGCIRLYNENIEWLYAQLQPGDLVLIQD